MCVFQKDNKLNGTRLHHKPCNPVSLKINASTQKNAIPTVRTTDYVRYKTNCSTKCRAKYCGKYRGCRDTCFMKCFTCALSSSTFGLIIRPVCVCVCVCVCVYVCVCVRARMCVREYRVRESMQREHEGKREAQLEPTELKHVITTK